MSKIKCLAHAFIFVATAFAGSARADEPAAPPPPAPPPAATEAAAPAPAATAVAAGTVAPAAAPTPPPPPYSLPWQLRPVGAVNVLRSDTAVAFYDNGAGASGSTVATMLLGSYKVTPSLAPMVRLGFTQNDAPAARRRRHVVRQSDRRRDVRAQGRRDPLGGVPGRDRPHRGGRRQHA